VRLWKSERDPAIAERASGASWTRLAGRNKQSTYLMTNSYWVHCSCYKGWGEPSNKGPLVAAAAVVVLESAGYKATGGAEVLEGLKGGAKGSDPVRGSVLAPTGEESRDAAGVGGEDGGCGGLLQVLDGAPGGGLAVASPAMGGGDAKRSSKVSNAAGAQVKIVKAVVTTTATIGAGNKRRMKLQAGRWLGCGAGVVAIRLVIQDGNNDLQQRTCEGQGLEKTQDGRV
jgi:hypothetical protein